MSRNGSYASAHRAAAVTAALFLCLGINAAEPSLISFAEGASQESLQTQAGSWHQDEKGRWYRHADGSYIRGGFEGIDGEYYYFDNEGYLVTGGLIYEGGLTYIVDGEGRMLRNTETVLNGTSYVIREDGHAVPKYIYEAAQGITGPSEDSADVSSNAGEGPVASGGGAAEAPGWIEDSTGWRYKRADGNIVVSDWELIDGTWYYFHEGGYMATDRIETYPDGRLAYLGSDGKPVKDTELSYNGVEYVADSEGFVTAKEPPKSENEIAAESYAQNIVSQITNGSMNKWQKATAIYNWLRDYMTYTTSGPQSDEAYSALYGFRRRSGCCYEYYAMAHYMLEAAGMPNIPVVRATDHGHYWNLVNVDGVWYHFDATPRRTGGRWCLVTTAYLRSHSWSSHNFDAAAYPATP